MKPRTPDKWDDLHPVVPVIRAAFMHGTFRKPFPAEAHLVPGDGYISELEKHICNVVVEFIASQSQNTTQGKDAA